MVVKLSDNFALRTLTGGSINFVIFYMKTIMSLQKKHMIAEMRFNLHHIVHAVTFLRKCNDNPKTRQR